MHQYIFPPFYLTFPFILLPISHFLWSIITFIWIFSTQVLIRGLFHIFPSRHIGKLEPSLTSKSESNSPPWPASTRSSLQWFGISHSNPIPLPAFPTPPTQVKTPLSLQLRSPCRLLFMILPFHESRLNRHRASFWRQDHWRTKWSVVRIDLLKVRWERGTNLASSVRLLLRVEVGVQQKWFVCLWIKRKRCLLVQNAFIGRISRLSQPPECRERCLNGCQISAL